MKRSSFLSLKLKESVSGEKNKDNHSKLIDDLRAEIKKLEKENFRLKIENRDAQRDNRNLRRKSKERDLSSYSFVPRSRLQTSGKENRAGEANYIPSSNRSNLLEKFENEDFQGKLATVVVNASDEEENNKE